MPPASAEPGAHAAGTRELIDLTRRRFEESVRFQHALAMFLQQITGVVETRDRALGETGLGTEIVQMRARTQELARDLERAKQRTAPAPATKPVEPSPETGRGQAALQELERQADGTLRMLISRDVVEYMDAPQLVRYLDVAFQKLQPGAAVSIDAINGACWEAFFGTYIRDTARTHVLHPDTLRFLVERAGFRNVLVVFPPSTGADRLPRAPQQDDPEMQAIADIINAQADRLNDHLFAALTFTVTATR